jgi:hypothetical protein
MIDSGSSLSFVGREVFNNIKELGLPHTVDKTQERCQTANAGICDVTQAVVLPIELYMAFHGKLDSWFLSVVRFPAFWDLTS